MGHLPNPVYAKYMPSFGDEYSFPSYLGLKRGIMVLTHPHPSLRITLRHRLAHVSRLFGAAGGIWWPVDLPGVLAGCGQHHRSILLLAIV